MRRKGNEACFVSYNSPIFYSLTHSLSHIVSSLVRTWVSWKCLDFDKSCPQQLLQFSAKWFLDCRIIFKTSRIRILIDLSLAQLTLHYASSTLRLGGYVRYRTFSIGIFYALHVTTMDYHSTILLQHSCLYAFCMILPVSLTLGMESQFIFTRLFWTIAFHTKYPDHYISSDMIGYY